MKKINRKSQLTNKNYFASINVTCALIFIASLILRWIIPSTIVTNSPNDDFLGVLQAHNLLQGNWLGSWNVNVLSKPPGYAFFLLIAHAIPTDPTVVLHFFYLVLGIYFRSLLGKKFMPSSNLSNRFLDVAFLVFAFNPAVFGQDFSKIYRTSLDSILSLAIVLLMLEIIHGYNIEITKLRSVATSKHTAKVPYHFGIWALLGFLFSWKFLTRSEALWLFAPSLLILGIMVFRFWIKSYKINDVKMMPQKSFRVSFYKSSTVGICTALVFAASPIFIVSEINKSHYGVFETENYFSGNFGKAYKLWEGVNQGRDGRLSVSISTLQRKTVYKISPTAALLEPIIEGTGPIAGWKNFNCQSPSHICDEAGPWFPWELRDAAFAAGRAATEIQFQKFFGQIAKDIENACQNRSISCGPKGTSVALGSWHFIPKKQLLTYAFNALNSMINFDSALNTARPNGGDDASQLGIWHSTLHFDRVSFTNSYDGWKAFDGGIIFLRSLYLILLPVLIVVGILRWLFKRKQWLDSSETFSTIFLILTIAIYLGGMALFEVATGFQAGFSEYCLPVQPIFLISLIYFATDPNISKFMTQVNRGQDAD